MQEQRRGVRNDETANTRRNRRTTSRARRPDRKSGDRGRIRRTHLRRQPRLMRWQFANPLRRPQIVKRMVLAKLVTSLRKSFA
jgi:hypothetical protein